MDLLVEQLPHVAKCYTAQNGILYVALDAE